MSLVNTGQAHAAPEHTLPCPPARRARAFSGVAAAAVAVSLLSLLPLGFILWVGYQTGWQAAAAMIFRPRVGELLVNTAWLVLLV
ncbi:MAG: hypothetical protein KA195_03420, partial [Burkholderiaceae bacterium]|nr:hypothetical protein [Burkholderiaceae bacterium]